MHNNSRFDADDFRNCVEDNCRSWEMDCQIQIAEVVRGKDFSYCSLLVQLLYIGSRDAFDAGRWLGLIETIEQCFSLAGCIADAVHSSTAHDSHEFFKQWMVSPRVYAVQNA